MRHIPNTSTPTSSRRARRTRSRLGLKARLVACLTVLTHFFSLSAPHLARAQQADSSSTPIELAPAASDTPAESRAAVEIDAKGEPLTDAEPSPEQSDESATSDPNADATRPNTVQALPDGPAKSAVTPQAISLPNAEGSIQGMGESFSPNLSAGTGTFTVPIALPPGRAGVQPALALSYGTSSGNGPVGVGWSLSAPFIARQTDRGLPRYVDRDVWHEQEDRFIYNGGQELVPVDSAEASAIDTGTIPAELTGWQQYRARVEGGFMRFFRSPDSVRWVVQDKGGTRFDFGLLESGEGPAEAVTASADALLSELDQGGGRIFQWNLTRMSDVHGSTVYYRYLADEGQRYLSEIHYVSPASCATSPADPEAQRTCSAPLTGYGRRVHIVYEPRDDVYDNYVTTWRTSTALRVRRIEVTSYDSTAGERTLVRRYHLRYDPTSFISLLSEVQVEGRPSEPTGVADVMTGVRTVSEASLDEAIFGDLLPPMQFTYSSPGPDTTDVIDGFGGLVPTVHDSPASPPVSLSEDRADLFDVNSDGLPDVIVTDPAHYRSADGAPAVGVFFNGFEGTDAKPSTASTFSDAISMEIPVGQSSVLNLGNLNINPMDMDGDGRSDILHMPRLANYGYFSPTRDGGTTAEEVSPKDQGWAWAKRDVVLPPGQLDPRIDFGRDGQSLQSVDVNNDGLIDIVRTTGTEMQTFLNLGWLPGGDGRFGSAEWTGSTWRLSTAPISSCVLQLGLPVDFADPEVRIADMNGDGIQDIVKIRKGRVAYWPGRGPGLWGDGDPSCGRNQGDGREVEMATPPQEVNAELENVFVNDVDMDGAADIVQVRFDEIDVWFNAAGHAFTDRTIIEGAPAAPGYARRIRFADLDGSGTTDIVYGSANHWQFIDPMGGQRPRLLIGVENGLGGVTELEYGSSAHEYLADLADAAECLDSSCDRFLWSRADRADARFPGHYRSGGSPVVSTVVTAVVSRDQFDQIPGQQEFVKRTEYRYHDGYYEGIEQEFRGFGAADAIEVGDDAEPTGITRTYFDQGRRPGDIASDRLADNPNEALKGHNYLTETFDELGTYLSTKHTTLTVRRLLAGLDGRSVSFGYVSRTDEMRYDTGPFAFGNGALSLTGVVRETATTGLTGSTVLGSEDRRVRLRSDHYAHMAVTVDEVDNAGNVRVQAALGRVRGEYGEPIPDERIITHEIPTLCSSTEWVWRVAETFVTGQGDAGQQLNRTTNSFAPGACDLSYGATFADLPHDTAGNGISFAFDGSTAAEALTQTDQAIEASTIYDSWGNALRTCGGGNLGAEGDTRCLRLAEIEYDDVLNQFPVSENIAASRTGPMAFSRLPTAAVWDEGLAVPVQTTDPNGLATGVTYDGLGRITSLTPPAGQDCQGSTTPITHIEYDVGTTGLPASFVTTTSEYDCDAGAAPLVSVGVIDGLGRSRALLRQAEGVTDPSEPDSWERSGVVRFNARGNMLEAFQADLLPSDGEPDAVSVLSPPSADIPSTFAYFDAFGRPISAVAEDGSVVRAVYHALSIDHWDPNDLDPGSPHYGTFATERTDGHGRSIDQTLRNRRFDHTELETYRLWTDYRADGKVVAVTRAESVRDLPRSLDTISTRGGRQHVTTRTLTYDTAGRRIASHDPDTDSRGPTRSSRDRSWRYLFNRVGDLAAIRDPRGCGQNFYYDHAGRLVAEHYVSCSESQQNGEIALDDVPTSAIGVDVGSGSGLAADARYYFDAYPDWLSTLEGFPSDQVDAIQQAGTSASPYSAALGRATAVMDRGQRTVSAYDDRGNILRTLRQVAVIPPAGTAPAAFATVQNDTRPAGSVTYDTVDTYSRSGSFDHGGRPIDSHIGSFGAVQRVVSGILGYNARGLPSSTSVAVEFPGGTYTQSVAKQIDYTRDGLVSRVVYGGGDGELNPAESRTSYDVRRRTSRLTTTRQASGLPGGLQAVSVVADQTLLWDRASNLIEVFDNRPSDEWPEGHKPASYRVGHDALYRVASVELDYSLQSGLRAPGDPFLDYRDELARVQLADPMRSKTAPLLPAPPPERVASLTYDYDWLANMVESSDDAYQFYERSLGHVSNGFDEADGRPSALRLASDLERQAPGSSFVPAGGRGGYLETTYGEGGNALTLTVHAQCTDDSFATGRVCYDPLLSLSERASFLANNCRCASEQHYIYRWDALNRLAEARRYDRVGGSGSYALAARQRYRYDASNQRTCKQSIGVEPGADPERIALYVFPGDFERRGVVTSTVSGSYVPAPSGRQEDQYLAAGARLVWTSSPPGALGQLEPDHRMTVALSDVLGTSTAVLDLYSRALVEASTYYPSGARESYWAEESGSVGSEPAGFSGKEADEEVGLTYFGQRYLIPRLGRWASPDPLHVHGLGGGEALNSYHYLGGNLLQARDPWGLDGEDRGARTDEQWDAARAYGKSIAYAQQAVEEASVEDNEIRLYTNNSNMQELESAGWAYRAQREDGKYEWRFNKDKALEVYRGMDDKVLKAWVSKWYQDTRIGQGLAEVADKVDTAVSIATVVAVGVKGLKALGKNLVRGLAKDALHGLEVSLRRWTGLLCSFVAGTTVATAEGPRPIEAIQVGDWVSVPEGSCDAWSVDGWVQVSLRQVDPTSGSVTNVELLRPKTMVLAAGYVVGAEVTIDLQDPELRGPAEVTNVRPYAATRAAAFGCPVTGTFAHTSQEAALELWIGHVNAPIVVDPKHPFLSAERGWTAAGDLRVGEKLTLRNGYAALARIERSPVDAPRVFNLEIGGAHAYFVDELGALVHNGCAKPALKLFDIERYGSFNIRSRAGDALEGHEILQNAWLEANAGAARSVGPLSRNNPALALPEGLHDAVTAQQRRLGLLNPENLRGMSAADNIALNSQAMRQAGVPEHVIQAAAKQASSYATSLSY